LAGIIAENEPWPQVGFRQQAPTVFLRPVGVVFFAVHHSKNDWHVMTENRQFRFTHDVNASAFSKELSHRVDRYFQERGISRHANAEMISKTVLGFVMTIAAYVWLMTGKFTALEVVGVYVVLGFAQLYMAFNIAHDANHSGYSKSKRVNRVLGCVFDLVGVSSYMWRLLHNTSHHSFVNIRGADTTFTSGNIFRFSTHDERRFFHRYQHLYAPFFYCLSSLDWVLTKDSAG
jgi:linoleoyl-CoA desaturase